MQRKVFSHVRMQTLAASKKWKWMKMVNMTGIEMNWIQVDTRQTQTLQTLDGEAIDSAWILKFLEEMKSLDKGQFSKSRYAILFEASATPHEAGWIRMAWFVESVFADSPMGFRWMSAWDTTLLSTVWGVIPVIPRCSAGIRKYTEVFALLSYVFFQGNTGGFIILIMFHP